MVFSFDNFVFLFAATCVVREKLESSQGFVSEEAVNEAVAEHVYENALPLFRGMIKQGRVRVTVPDHEKVGRCLNGFHWNAASSRELITSLWPAHSTT